MKQIDVNSSYVAIIVMACSSVMALGCSDPLDDTPADDSTSDTGTLETSSANSTATPSEGSSAEETTTQDPMSSTGAGTTSGAASSGEGSSDEGSSGEATTGEPSAPTFDLLEACMADMVATPELSGAAAAVVIGDEIVWSQGFGVRQPDSVESVDVDTRFRVASVTKVMTAITAMSLVDEGAVALDTPLGEVLPPFGDLNHPDWSAALTLRELLAQQGGLYDYLTLDGPREDEALADAVLGELFTQIPYLVEPGTFWNYSNANFSVAGMVAEHTAQVPYRSAVHERLLTPLDMTRTLFDVDEVELDGNYAYGWSAGQVFAAQDFDNGWARPAGYAWSTVIDLAKMAIFLKDGNKDILSEQAYVELVSPQVNTLMFLDRMAYGLGLFHNDFIPLATGFVDYDNIEHGGNLPGYTSLVHIAPEFDVAIALVGNGDGLDFYPCVAAAMNGLPEFDQEPSIPDLQADLTDPMDYVGSYAEPIGIVGDFSISMAPSGQLEVNFPLLDMVSIPYEPALTPISHNNYLIIIQGQPFILTGIFDAEQQLQYLRTRLFVAQPAGVIVPLPSAPFDATRTQQLIADQHRLAPSRIAATLRAVRPD